MVVSSDGRIQWYPDIFLTKHRLIPCQYRWIGNNIQIEGKVLSQRQRHAYKKTWSSHVTLHILNSRYNVSISTNKTVWPRIAYKLTCIFYLFDQDGNLIKRANMNLLVQLSQTNLCNFITNMLVHVKFYSRHFCWRSYRVIRTLVKSPRVLWTLNGAWLLEMCRLVGIYSRPIIGDLSAKSSAGVIDTRL